MTDLRKKQLYAGLDKHSTHVIPNEAQRRVALSAESSVLKPLKCIEQGP